MLVVGHKPSLPRLVSHLLAGDPGAVGVEMGYAAACTVEIPLAAERARGRLIRLAPADALRALAL